MRRAGVGVALLIVLVTAVVGVLEPALAAPSMNHGQPGSEVAGIRWRHVAPPTAGIRWRHPSDPNDAPTSILSRNP